MAFESRVGSPRLLGFFERRRSEQSRSGGLGIFSLLALFCIEGGIGGRLSKRVITGLLRRKLVGGGGANDCVIGVRIGSGSRVARRRGVGVLGRGCRPSGLLSGRSVLAVFSRCVSRQRIGCFVSGVVAGKCLRGVKANHGASCRGARLLSGVRWRSWGYPGTGH